jgi:hypothetical protein
MQPLDWPRFTMTWVLARLLVDGGLRKAKDTSLGVDVAGPVGRLARP